MPAELRTLRTAADDVFRRPASGAVRRMTGAWKEFRGGQVPPRLETRMNRQPGELARAVEARDLTRSRLAAIAVGQSALDLELRHRPAAEIDRDRFELWARQLLVDAKAGDAAGVRGDLATLEWIRDRFVHTLRKAGVARIDSLLVELRANVTDEDLSAVARNSARLGATVGG